MKLYKVAAEVVFYMMAEDEGEARADAYDFAREAMADGAATDVRVWQATRPELVPPDWLDALPYNGDGETTVGEILAGKSTP